VSFILDALRKSEHDRQRQAGPGLAEVAVAAPRARSNLWAIAAVVLLIVNLGALGVWLIRRGSAPEPPAPAAAPAASPDSTAAQTTVTATAPATPPPMLRPAAPAPVPAAIGTNPLAAEVSEPELALSSGADAAPEGPPAVTRTPARPGSVVYESMPEADPPATAAAVAAPAEGSGTSGLPTADELIAKGAVAPLRLELHVYSTQAPERFVFINSTRYREGDRLAEGPVVEEITRDGVVLSQAGNRFVLPRQ
jgi:hypothetical protein